MTFETTINIIVVISKRNNLKYDVSKHRNRNNSAVKDYSFVTLEMFMVQRQKYLCSHWQE